MVTSIHIHQYLLGQEQIGIKLRAKNNYDLPVHAHIHPFLSSRSPNSSRPSGSPRTWTRWTKASRPRWPTSSTARHRSSQSWCFSENSFVFSPKNPWNANYRRETLHVKKEIELFLSFLFQVFVSTLIPHLLIGLLPFALALAALQVMTTNNETQLLTIFQVFFSRSKCQVKPNIPAH